MEQAMTEIDIAQPALVEPPALVPPPSVAPPASFAAVPAPAAAADGGFFVGTDATAIAIDALQGDMGAAVGAASSGAGAGAGASAVSGMSSFAQQQGFGWMMELDDEEEEELKPILEELDIDLADIWFKIRCVLLPLDALGFKRNIVKDKPDFWGPLMVVLLFSMVSMWGNFKSAGWIITIWFVGSALIYVLVAVMGEPTATFSQALGIIGYSLLPLILTSALMAPLVYHIPVLNTMVHVLGVAWSAQSAGSLLVTEALASKNVLVWYPIALLYGYFLSLYTGA